MKKNILYFISILFILMLPFSASASTVRLSIECTNINVGAESTCNIYATPDNGLAAARGTISITGNAVQFVSASNGSLPGTINQSSFNLYGTPQNGKTLIGVIKVRGVSSGTGTITVVVDYITDGSFVDNSLFVQGTGRVTVGGSTPTTTTTTKKTNPSQPGGGGTPTTTRTYNPGNPGQTTTRTYNPYVPGQTTTRTYNPYLPSETTTRTYDPNSPDETTTMTYDPNSPEATTTNSYNTNDPTNTLITGYDPQSADPYRGLIPDPTAYEEQFGAYLEDTSVTHAYISDTLQILNLTVDEYPVKYERGVYYVLVDKDRESVEINATTPEGTTVSGTGRRALAYGNNAVPLILRDQVGGAATVYVIIARPDGRNANTLLQSLEVVGYNLEFKQDVFEYTVTVPYKTKEVNIIAKALDSSAIVTGAGTIVLDGSETNAYVKVSYSDLSSTTYTIKIKKTYISLIPMILLGIGGCGVIGGIVYLVLKNKKKKIENANTAIAKEAAEMRNQKQLDPQISLNGTSSSTIGSRIVQPTLVESNPVESNITVNVQTSNPVAAEVQTKVIDSKPTTTPGMIPPKVVPVNNLSTVANAPQPQVKVVKNVTIAKNPTVVKKVIINSTNNQ